MPLPRTSIDLGVDYDDFSPNVTPIRDAFSAYEENFNALYGFADTFDIVNPQPGQIIRWDGSHWVVDDYLLSKLVDVAIYQPQDGQFLRYDENLQLWINASQALNDLTDVLIANPQNSQVVKYDGNGALWVNDELLVTELGDVAITNPQDNDVFIYDGNTQTWRNKAPAFGTTIAGMTDVQLSSLGDKQILRWNDSLDAWVNVDYALNLLTDVTIGTPQNYHILTYINGVWTNVVAPGAFQSPGARTLDELDDVAISNPQPFQTLVYNGSLWVNGVVVAEINQNVSLNTGSFTDAINCGTLVNGRPILSATVKFEALSASAGQGRLVDNSTSTVLQTVDIDGNGFVILSYENVFDAKTQTIGNIKTTFTATVLNQ